MRAPEVERQRIVLGKTFGAKLLAFFAAASPSPFFLGPFPRPILIEATAQCPYFSSNALGVDASLVQRASVLVIVQTKLSVSYSTQRRVWKNVDAPRSAVSVACSALIESGSGSEIAAY